MRLLLVLLLAATAAFSQVPLSEYRERRNRLRNAMPSSIVILAANSEHDVIDDSRGPFYQEPNFLYLTGWNEPAAVLVITPKEDFLFIPRRNSETEKWTGRKAAPEDADIKAVTGFENVLPVESLESRLPQLLESAPKVFGLPQNWFTPKLKAMLPLRELSDPTLPIARLRMEKSKAEIAVLQKAVNVSIEAHRASWNLMAAGLYEYQIAAKMVGVWQDRGCFRNGYAPIVGSGPNATILHYSRNSRRMDQGELLLVDAGAECDGYVADITRTVPINHKFTPRQREIYNIVLGAQRAAIKAAKPGMTFGKTSPDGLYKIAFDYIDSHGKDLKGGSLGRYFIHGLSHHVGLEVHDAFDPALPLKAGMVITIEPGIYIPEEGIGVRIEDMLLITENGAQVMTAALPTDPDEIEKALARKSKANAVAR